eukprot:TRINITY_DN5889_c0_g2_i2.p1 TRINITY_DN5889_c0_g2~~TRINITY_DN5889_c0_g2_i2.p1  ORF type:complete len:669 (-),score=77.76 TRINITY_DN5889_c0_g2_i2:1609-3615(-)
MQQIRKVQLCVLVIAIQLFVGIRSQRQEECKCNNERPPSAQDYSCVRLAGWGKCDRSYLQGYCNASCQRCDCPCVDTVPDDSDATCEQRKQWGACEKMWMIEGFYCARSCGYCGNDTDVSSQSASTRSPKPLTPTPQQLINPADSPVINPPLQTPITSTTASSPSPATNRVIEASTPRLTPTTTTPTLTPVSPVRSTPTPIPAPAAPVRATPTPVAAQGPAPVSTAVAGPALPQAVASAVRTPASQTAPVPTAIVPQTEVEVQSNNVVPSNRVSALDLVRPQTANTVAASTAATTAVQQNILQSVREQDVTQIARLETVPVPAPEPELEQLQPDITAPSTLADLPILPVSTNFESVADVPFTLPEEVEQGVAPNALLAPSSAMIAAEDVAPVPEVVAPQQLPASSLAVGISQPGGTLAPASGLTNPIAVGAVEDNVVDPTVPVAGPVVVDPTAPRGLVSTPLQAPIVPSGNPIPAVPEPLPTTNVQSQVAAVAPQSTTTSMPMPPGECQTVYEIMSTDPDLSTSFEIWSSVRDMQAQGYDDETTPFTVFVPVNAAWTNYTIDHSMTQDELMSNLPLLDRLVTFHELPEPTLSTEWYHGMNLRSELRDIYDKRIIVLVGMPNGLDGEVRLLAESQALVIERDIEACSAVVMKLNDIMVPSGARLPPLEN